MQNILLILPKPKVVKLKKKMFAINENILDSANVPFPQEMDGGKKI